MEISVQSFKNIASKKGVKITFNEPEPIHLDMNMVEASLQMAIQNCGNASIKAKLVRL